MIQYDLYIGGPVNAEHKDSIEHKPSFNSYQQVLKPIFRIIFWMCQDYASKPVNGLNNFLLSFGVVGFLLVSFVILFSSCKRGVWLNI